MALQYPSPLPTFLPIDTDPVELPPSNQPLEIIAQPYYTSKLRYRSDYEKNKNRRGVLHSRNNPNYQSPAIRIPPAYLDVAQQYYIRVCLVTVENERTKCRYIHPYELEDIENNEYNDRQNKAVWFPIQREDGDGIKSFPNLRIVKLTANDLQNHGDLRVFDSPNSLSTLQLSGVKETIKEFNLDKAQLAYTIGKKIIGADNITCISYASTTVFSEELNEIITKESDPDTGPSESTTVRSDTSKSLNCRMYKYAPRNGYTVSNDEVLIFFTNKLKPKKYGDLEVRFEYGTPDNLWSESVLNLEVKDQMVSFRTPNFPFPIDNYTTVNVILKQKKRNLEPLQFDYIPIMQCPQCQRNAMSNSERVTQTNPNKRRYSSLYADDEVSDSITFVPEDSEPVTSSSSTIINPAFLTPVNEDASEQIFDKLANGIASLFSNQDFLPILRIYRPFIRKCPELFHDAIRKNYSDLLPNFISIAGIQLLQHKNELGETVLLHAARLNRLDIITAILKKDNSDKLLEDINDKKQNIFHILALNANSDEIFDLLIDHLLKNSIKISEKFDHIGEDNHTPLQLAISNNNLPATRHLLKYFNKNICQTSDHTDDNLIHLAVRYGDLTMLEPLLDQRQIMEQGNQSNFTTIRIELAQ